MRNFLIVLFAYVATCVCIWATCDVNPSTITIDGLASPTHSLNNNPGSTPLVAWTACDANQENWQVRFGKDLASTPAWYWDSGTSAKGPAAGNTSVPFEVSQNVVCTGAGAPFACCTGSGTGTNCTFLGSSNGALDFTSHPTYVGVRTLNSGGAFGAWAVVYYQRGVHPIQPADPLVSTYSGSTPDPNWAATTATNGDTETFYVDAATGNDSTNNCTAAKNPATPKATICDPNGGISCIDSAGDTVEIADGTYSEQCALTSSFPTGNKVGDNRNPITIKATNRGGVIWDEPVAGNPNLPAISINGRSFWTFDGFVLQNSKTGHSQGSIVTEAFIRIIGGTQTTLQYLSTGTNADPNNLCYVGMDSSGNDHRVLNSTFTTNHYHTIDITGAVDTTIRGCTFASASSQYHGAIQTHGTNNSGGVLIQGNTFRDMTPTTSAISLYIDSAGAFVVDNIFYNLHKASSTNYSPAIEVIRSGGVRIENNSFYFADTNMIAPLSLMERSRLVEFRNNIVQGGQYGITFSQDSHPDYDSVLGFVSEYNLFCGQTTGYYKTKNQANADDSNTPEYKEVLVRENNNCKAASCSSGGCKPLFTDPNNGDLTLGLTSNAIDTATTWTPVPTGGGTRRDKGAREMDANNVAITWPYTSYAASLTTTDTTPKFSWRFVDMDNWLHRTYPGMFSDTERQTRKQVQVDTAVTFDSQTGGNPLYDTGVIVEDPPTYSYIPPTLSAIVTPGTYYVRFRYRDDSQTGYNSSWSVPLAFTIQ